MSSNFLENIGTWLKIINKENSLLAMVYKYGSVFLHRAITVHIMTGKL